VLVVGSNEHGRQNQFGSVDSSVAVVVVVVVVGE